MEPMFFKGNTGHTTNKGMAENNDERNGKGEKINGSMTCPECGGIYIQSSGCGYCLTCGYSSCAVA